MIIGFNNSVVITVMVEAMGYFLFYRTYSCISYPLDPKLSLLWRVIITMVENSLRAIRHKCLNPLFHG